MYFTKRVENAVQLVAYLRKNNAYETAINLKTVSEDTDISLAFLEQIAGKLKIAKIIKSKRGPGGGYTIKKDTIPLRKVFVAVKEKMPKSRYNCELLHKLADNCETAIDLYSI